MKGFIFDPAEFFGSADCLKYFPLLIKKQLVECAEWLGVLLQTADTRADILVLVGDKLKQELAKAEYSGSESEVIGDTEESSSEGFEEGKAPVNALGDSKEEKQFNLICKRIELKKMEFEENERIRRHELEMVKLNIKMAKLQGANLISSPKRDYQDRFDIGIALKWVLVLEEKDVPEFFKAFERVASRLSWPAEMCTVLIQCRLVGKAMRVYNALEEGVAWGYKKVKALILKSYDLDPEAHRLLFRIYTKHPVQSFVEFARVKEEQFDDSLKSRQTGTFPALYELLLLEEFKKACSRELRVHLEEVQLGHKGSCYWCNKPGHFQNQCNARRMYLERNIQSTVALVSDKSEVKFFRDTGSARSLVLKKVINGFEKDTGNFVLLGGFLDSVVSAPLVNIRMSFLGFDHVTVLAVVDSLPIPCIDGILGNDMLDNEGWELFPIL
ncbi:uncharacterized protein [Palaemon carinicauda]|uniref:uncharacterized protein n=1 Tax=Palaemon carinicauda TaxID=392227 RepID=UPI0035B5F7CE